MTDRRLAIGMLIAIFLLSAVSCFAAADATTEPSPQQFADPPAAARPWVYWFWINGNISKEGITADLESFQRVGVGGVLWMEVSGPAWAPDGPVVPLSPEWHQAVAWALHECQRLGLEFDMTLDFGYGSGGPHISPQLSMQRLLWSETEVAGGKKVALRLDKPKAEKALSAWLRPGAKIPEAVTKALEASDGYRDVAVLAMPLPAAPQARAYRIPELDRKNGLSWLLPTGKGAGGPPPAEAVAARDQVLDLTDKMDERGQLTWEAPPGPWLVLRFGQASNLKMTRPCPQAAVGLECDRLSPAGIETHFAAFLQKVIEQAGPAAGPTLAYAHIDSWEAGGQNWTAAFPAEFQARRGYALRPWLPVLTGRVVGSPELSERFLWDVRATTGEMIRDHYARRLGELAAAHGVRLSIEAYGHLCIDNLSYAGVCDMPISEFWARGNEPFPLPRNSYSASSKAMASAAHTGGRPVVGAEAFTGDRGWRDHPYTIKGLGDRMFCDGVNRMIGHLSAHQAYADMIPGLTHRRWGEHFNRYNTWWEQGRAWMHYLARCQYLLQQGRFVADVAYWFGEGAPLNVNDMTLDLPPGYDFDLCASEVVMQMSVHDGLLHLPSGMSYRYLLLPNSERLTAAAARKIRQLVDAGARVLGGPRPSGSPSLSDCPAGDAEVAKLAADFWDTGRIVSGQTMAEVLRRDALPPDFEGRDLLYIHRLCGEADAYFVSYQQEQPGEVECTFRVAGKRPELWDPETGAVRPLPEFREHDGRITIPLRFEPFESWFVVFRPGGPAAVAGAKNFTTPRLLRPVEGAWQVTFDPRWGGPQEPVSLPALGDWSHHADPAIEYYSGTAVYRRKFDWAPSDVQNPASKILLDLGRVEVMAQVTVNGSDCGIAWKPPYRVDISRAVRPGENELAIAVVNLWINRMIGDEQLPEDCHWLDFETLAEWPQWFTAHQPRPSGRYTFTTCRHYKKDSPLVPSGLFGPVSLLEASGPQ